MWKQFHFDSLWFPCEIWNSEEITLRICFLTFLCLCLSFHIKQRQKKRKKKKRATNHVTTLSCDVYPGHFSVLVGRCVGVSACNHFHFQEVSFPVIPSAKQTWSHLLPKNRRHDSLNSPKCDTCIDVSLWHPLLFPGKVEVNAVWVI